MLKRIPPSTAQVSDSREESSGARPTHTYTMPGLIPDLAQSFWRDRQHHSPRGMARNNEVAETHQIGACLRDLHARVTALEKRWDSVATVRELQQSFRRAG